jgi:hypothetical protein
MYENSKLIIQSTLTHNMSCFNKVWQVGIYAYYFEIDKKQRCVVDAWCKKLSSVKLRASNIDEKLEAFSNQSIELIV